MLEIDQVRHFIYCYVQYMCICIHRPVWRIAWRHLVNDIDLRRRPKSAKNPLNPLFWRSRSFKVIEFGANRKPVYDLLLVINSNLGLISHRYRESLAKNSKFCLPPSHLGPSFGVTPFEFIEKHYGSWN